MTLAFSCLVQRCWLRLRAFASAPQFDYLSGWKSPISFARIFFMNFVDTFLRGRSKVASLARREGCISTAVIMDYEHIDLAGLAHAISLAQFSTVQTLIGTSGVLHG